MEVKESEVAQSCPTLCDLWTVGHQPPLSVGFSRQEYWSGLLFPPPGDLPDLGIKPTSLRLLQRNTHCMRIFTAEPSEEPHEPGKD